MPSLRGEGLSEEVTDLCGRRACNKEVTFKIEQNLEVRENRKVEGKGWVESIEKVGNFWRQDGLSALFFKLNFLF